MLNKANIYRTLLSIFFYKNRKKKVNIFITYDPKLINETKINELKERFNNN